MGAKRAVNISVDADLIEEAKGYGYNLSAVCAEAIERKNREERIERARAENKAAMDCWNEWIDKNGIPFDDVKAW